VCKCWLLWIFPKYNFVLFMHGFLYMHGFLHNRLLLYYRYFLWESVLNWYKKDGHLQAKSSQFICVFNFFTQPCGCGQFITIMVLFSSSYVKLVLCMLYHGVVWCCFLCSVQVLGICLCSIIVRYFYAFVKL